MKKGQIKHENLRKILNEIYSLNGDISDELLDRLVFELQYSNLILAVNDDSENFSLKLVPIKDEEYGLVFTDMAEFQKVFSFDECQSMEYGFDVYLELIENGFFDGFIINIGTEGFLFSKNLLERCANVNRNSLESENKYSLEEIKEIFDSIDNDSLERFLKNPENIGLYKELFGEISNSTLLTLLTSQSELESCDGIVDLHKTDNLAFLYVNEIGGDYATVYTSKEKLAEVQTEQFRYCQLVNFHNLFGFVLENDMDGIIINCESDNVLITRDVLIEHSSLISQTCDNKKLDSALFYLFLVEHC